MTWDKIYSKKIQEEADKYTIGELTDMLESKYQEKGRRVHHQSESIKLADLTDPHFLRSIGSAKKLEEQGRTLDFFSFTRIYPGEERQSDTKTLEEIPKDKQWWRVVATTREKVN